MQFISTSGGNPYYLDKPWYSPNVFYSHGQAAEGYANMRDLPGRPSPFAELLGMAGMGGFRQDFITCAVCTDDGKLVFLACTRWGHKFGGNSERIGDYGSGSHGNLDLINIPYR